MIWKEEVFTSFKVPPQYFFEETRKTALLYQCKKRVLLLYVRYRKQIKQFIAFDPCLWTHTHTHSM
jgi:hypothetical protein